MLLLIVPAHIQDIQDVQDVQDVQDIYYCGMCRFWGEALTLRATNSLHLTGMGNVLVVVAIYYLIIIFLETKQLCLYSLPLLV